MLEPIPCLCGHCLLCVIRYTASASCSVDCSAAFIPGREGHCLVSWFYSQIVQTGTLSSGHSLSGCFSLHLEQKIDRAASASACFFFTCRASICEAKELNISVLNSSNKLPISARVAPPLADFWTLEYTLSLPFNLLAAPLEHLIQRLIISSNDSLEMSPFQSIFSMSKQSSRTPFNNIVFRMSLFIPGWSDRCRLYCNHSTKSSKLSSSL